MIRRVAVGLPPKVWGELMYLIKVTGHNRTDVVNRAISLYAALQPENDKQEIIVRKADGKEYLLMML